MTGRSGKVSVRKKHLSGKPNGKNLVMQRQERREFQVRKTANVKGTKREEQT